MDRYEVKRKIGQGSFGDVHLVIHRQTQKLYAIKEIQTSFSNRKEQNDITREVEILSNLAHPNIVRYIESFRHYASG